MLSFLHLPAEIRFEIYRYLLVRDKPARLSWPHKRWLVNAGRQPAILRCCRLIHDEALIVLYGENQIDLGPNLQDLLPLRAQQAIKRLTLEDQDKHVQSNDWKVALPGLSILKSHFLALKQLTVQGYNCMHPKLLAALAQRLAWTFARMAAEGRSVPRFTIQGTVIKRHDPNMWWLVPKIDLRSRQGLEALYISLLDDRLESLILDVDIDDESLKTLQSLRFAESRFDEAVNVDPPQHFGDSDRSFQKFGLAWRRGGSSEPIHEQSSHLNAHPAIDLEAGD
ncbi:MAG: hypothetical protein Q9227_009158 [Pyrenula ochraceoflavens]